MAAVSENPFVSPVSDSESDSECTKESPYEVEVRMVVAKRVIGRPIEIGDQNIKTSGIFNVPKVVGPCLYPYRGCNLPTLEVFSVRINNYKNGGRYLYGSFKVQESRVYWLFKQENPDHEDADGAESLDPDQTGEVQLIEPNENTINCEDRPFFEMTLSNENSNRPSYGFFTWGSLRKDLYNVPLASTFDGEFGSVTVNYAMFKQPLVAKIEVVLLHDKHSNNNNNSYDADNQACQGEAKRLKSIKTANVFGRISARNSFFGSELDESMLFNKKEKSSLCVNYGENIPLSRSLVTIPYPAALIVKVDLWDCYQKDNNSVSLIAKGNVELVLNKDYTSVSNISENIQVNITWGYFFGGGKGYMYPEV